MAGVALWINAYVRTAAFFSILIASGAILFVSVPLAFDELSALSGLREDILTFGASLTLLLTGSDEEE
jgi:uncharacterized membrane protein YphA (DoxX/SURF4 family)